MRDLKKIESYSELLESMNETTYEYIRWCIKQFEKSLHGDILEIGCGTGNITEFLPKYGKVWAIDNDKEYITKTARRLENKVKVGYGDIEKGQYFFRKKTFDTIVCVNVLEHIKDDSRALKNIHNLLKTGGNLILQVPAHPFLYGQVDKAIGHYRRYEKGNILKLLKKGNFNVIKFRRLNFLGALGWYVTVRILKISSIKRGQLKIFNLLSPFFLFLEKIIQPPIGISLLVISKKIK